MNLSVLIAELRKLWTIPVLRWLLVSPVVIGLVAGLGGSLSDRLPNAVTAAWLLTMTATVLATSLAAGSEFRHRTIVMSVLGAGFNSLAGAKLIVAASVGVATGVSCGATIALGAFVSPGRIDEPMDLLWTALTGTAGTVCWAIIGVGLAYLVKRSDILVVLVLVWCLFLEPLLVTLMWLADAGFAFVAGPAMASVALTNSGTLGSIDLLSRPQAVFALAFWALAAAGGGWRMARNRALV